MAKIDKSKYTKAEIKQIRLEKRIRKLAKQNKIFLNHKRYSQKYEYDFTNCLKKNFGKKLEKAIQKP